MIPRLYPPHKKPSPIVFFPPLHETFLFIAMRSCERLELINAQLLTSSTFHQAMGDKQLTRDV